MDKVKRGWVPIAEIMLETLKDIALKQNDAEKRKKYLTDLVHRAKEMEERGVDIGKFDIYDLDSTIQTMGV